MKHISILIPKGHASVVNIGGTHQILSWVNAFYEESERTLPFQIKLVGLEKHTLQTPGLFTINPEVLINEVTNTDLIVIPAIHGDFEKNLELNAAFIPWIVDHYKKGAEIVSLCVASFFLAETGLLDGKRCSTHWSMANFFRERFPKVELQDNKILTDAEGIYTSGGAYAFTNLIVYLIEKYTDRETAVMAAKSFMVDIDRGSQSPFMIFSGQKAHNDPIVLKAQEHIEKHFTNRIVIDDLSGKMALSRRTFERRFKKATANTVLEYHQRVKIEAAKKELEKGRKTVNEVMYEVGYNDPKSFRDVFKKIVGISPREYKGKYTKAIAG
ncbi:GlxA family transcriptional regulator [Pareuzebyella sediminis]|uniref:GlxA family transcriptional regulator n=1 Tax=Pareuzebyella sediminis TaxID=2607998 RepID=UPI0011EF4B4E|nr:helix-turn-helix domain-containing protein [Pareuzebyella sediminis]